MSTPCPGYSRPWALMYAPRARKGRPRGRPFFLRGGSAYTRVPRWSSPPVPKAFALSPVRPLTLYLLATGSWFAALGVQTVFFTWLVTLALHESPDKVGLAQFTMMLPTLALILWAGVAADRLGGARLATWAQSLSLLPVLGLGSRCWLRMPFPTACWFMPWPWGWCRLF